ADSQRAALQFSADWTAAQPYLCGVRGIPGFALSELHPASQPVAGALHASGSVGCHSSVSSRIFLRAAATNGGSGAAPRGTGRDGPLAEAGESNSRRGAPREFTATHRICGHASEGTVRAQGCVGRDAGATRRGDANESRPRAHGKLLDLSAGPSQGGP